MSDDFSIIAERENALYVALTASDADALGDILSDDVTDIHSTSIAQTRKEQFAGQRHGVHKHDAIATIERRTRMFGNIAVTRGVIDMVDTAAGQPFTMCLRETLGWIKEGEVWRLPARLATKLPL